MHDYFADLSPAVPNSSSATGHNDNRSVMRVSPASPVAPGRFEHVVVEAVAGTTWTDVELWEALAPEDRVDVQAGDVDADTLRKFIRVVDERQLREAGWVPATYTERSWCNGCGPIWLWIRASVLGCPWCANRRNGRPVPRPDERGGGNEL